MGEVVIAFDGDEPGQKALDTVLLNTLDVSDSEKNYIRNLSLNKMPVDQAIRSLSNWELSDELGLWNAYRKVHSAPEWWYDMCEKFYSACLREITSRSSKVNDLHGFDYIETYNKNNTITDVLAEYGVVATPGRTVHCPMHDDTTPSLTVFADNLRAYCFNQACILYGNGHGESAFGLYKILSR